MKEEDDEDEKGIGVVRYQCMPSLVTLLQMRNRLHLAYIGKKLMKWTAMATGKELRKIAQELTEAYATFRTDYRNAYILQARCRYFYPNLNSIVLENIPRKASVTVGLTMKSITGVRVFKMAVKESGIEPYEHLGIEKGGHAIQEAKEAWLTLLKRIIYIVELRSCFEQVEMAHKCATKKKNVLAKVIIPKLLLSIRYIAVELEEAEREETFRLKRVKQKKDRERYLLADIIEGELREGTVAKKPADIKKEQTGQSIQPKAEPVAPKSPPLAPVPVAEMGDLAIIMPPGDITDPGDVFIPPREYATLEPINEIEELIDEQVSSEILDDADTIESIKFGESFETGEWFETPSEDYRVTSRIRVVQGKEEKIDLTLSDSKADELSRTTEVDEPPDSDKSSASNKQIDRDDIEVKDDPDVLKNQLLEDLTSILEIVDTAREYSFISTPEKYDESISSLENPTIKFRETAEALSFSVVDTHDDDIEQTDTLESEQVEQDLFQPLRSDSEKEATTSILKQTSNYDQPASEDKSNDYERKDIDITEDILNEVPLENPIDLNSNPTDGKNCLQTDTEAEIFKTEQLVNDDNKSIEVTQPESMQNEPSDHKNKILNAVADEEFKVDTNANEIKDHSEDTEVKIHESPEQPSKEEAQKTIDKSKEDKEGEDKEKANKDAKQTMNRPLRILSSDEILEQERLRNAQTEDKKEEEKPDK